VADDGKHTLAHTGVLILVTNRNCLFFKTKPKEKKGNRKNQGKYILDANGPAERTAPLGGRPGAS
jgi:hypothetical protein